LDSSSHFKGKSIYRGVGVVERAKIEKSMAKLSTSPGMACSHGMAIKFAVPGHQMDG
jgi:hypothetical protein